MGNAGDSKRQIKSVTRSVEILSLLRQLDGATVTELATEVDLTPGTVHTHLSTLRECGLAVKEHDDLYRLSLEFITMGEHVRNGSPLFKAGREIVDKLAMMSGESVHLITEKNGTEVILWEAFGQNAVGTEFYIHNRERPNRHLHYSASGKALLAYLDSKRVDEIFDECGLVQQTPQTVTDREVLERQLQDVRERGYAFNDEEGASGIRAVGAPIFDPKGQVIGAVSLSAPAAKMSEELFRNKVPDVVVQTANLIEVNLQAVLIG
ncbi:IclR family transcriptional regulator [Natrarchaeobius chitinivorans]|uniref:IclR family transcriptional regulator n=1 Tax=Natrarchaeobius chitinivorans TaxID=1679083 RepID=A0A3N6LTX3_NATCH|nr:IclR family transcriptional regulator [Natrarchaeobius chitinivorans]RQG93613.1 IclR family transcriptional regulator [Natrarchaeobius chitinivorans]